MDIMRKNTSYFAYLTIPLDNENHNSFLHTLWSRTIESKNGNIPPLSLQPQMQFICFFKQLNIKENNHLWQIQNDQSVQLKQTQHTLRWA